jgi:S1-C subfamily serine protease
MNKMRFVVLGGLTTVAALGAAFVVAAPAKAENGQAIVAQATPERSDDQSDRRRVMVLDGRGSQLGVMVQDSNEGVRIDQVDPNSPASKAGLREGDLVTEYDGERVRSARQLTRLVQETADGRSVRIGIVRGGQKQTVDATPEARSFDWSINIGGDRIRRDVERSMRGLDELRAFRLNPRDFDFRFDDLPGLRSPSRGRLGVTVEPLTAQLQEFFGAKDGGVLVSSVTAGSAAEKAGVKAGDVITTINGDAVRDTNDLIDEINQVSGTELTIGIVRERKASTLKATLDSQTPRRETRPRQPAAYVRPA